MALIGRQPCSHYVSSLQTFNHKGNLIHKSHQEDTFSIIYMHNTEKKGELIE